MPMEENKSAYQQLLYDFKFTAEELRMLRSKGWMPDRILAEINGWLDNKPPLTTQGYARQTFEEWFPNLFGITAEAEAGGRIAINATQYEVKPHEFLWKPYIPLNDVTLFMAAGGTGKTMLCCWLLAQISNGGWIPGDITRFSNPHLIAPPPQKGLYISAEDDGDELRGRLEASNANLNNIFILDKIESVGMSYTEGYEEFLNTIKQVEPALVIIDPWQAFIGMDIDVNRTNHIRPSMQKLSKIASECNCSIVLISHINKRRQGENINNAASGSADLVNASRSVLALTFSDENTHKDERILVHTKANYSELGESLKFQISAMGGLIYDGTSKITRQLLEEAARKNKTIAEVMAERKSNSETADRLREAIEECAVEGENINIAYQEMMDEFGDDIFGGSTRPSKALQMCESKLKEKGIILEFKTAAGKPKKKNIGQKSYNSFGIYKKTPDKQ